MPLVIVALALAALFYLLKFVVSAEFASVVLAILSVVVTLTYQECRYIFGLDQDPSSTKAKSFLGRTVNALASWFQYIDLSFLLVAIGLVGIVIYNAFVASVDDLVNNGFIIFNKATDGYVHLQTYLGGFVLMPLLVFALGGYGFRRGFVARSGSFPKFLVAVITGALVMLGLLYAARGDSPASANTELLAHANPQAIPVGARSLAGFNSLGASVLFLVCLAAYAWVCSLVGRLVRAGTDRLEQLKRQRSGAFQETPSK